MIHVSFMRTQNKPQELQQSICLIIMSIMAIPCNLYICHMHMKGATEPLFTARKERALGALNGTLMIVSLGASHKIVLFSEKMCF